jgi:quercetin dioxygenase-like cupin family protein
MIEIRKSGEDARGESFIIKREGLQVAHLVTIKAGASRGGHFHNEPETLVVLDGELDYSLTDMKTKREVRGLVSKGETLKVNGGFAHLLTARTDALLIGIIGDVESTTYQPYRRVVEDFLARSGFVKP